MVRKDIVMMSQRELRRVSIIQKVLEKEIRQKEAGDILSLSDRQIRRIIKRVREEGEGGIIHKGRGSVSGRGIPKRVKQRVIKLCRSRYVGFGPTLACEKLYEIDRIEISRETLRGWLREEGIGYKRRKGRAHRRWRERKEYFGQMVQMDGSDHDWFEGRGVRCIFMGYVDDATGIVFGRFYTYEGTIPAMDSFRGYIERYGIPLSVYLDKHTTYKSTKKPSIEDELNGVEALSQFERALKELAVEVIHANSAQAKGRVERIFRTFQDRVIKEMRLNGISTIGGANKFLEGYLPVYNARFPVRPAKEADVHRPLPKGIDLDRILCIRTRRVLRNDSTVAHDGKLYQIEDEVRAQKVFVEERTNGSMFITHRDVALKYKEIVNRPQKAGKRPKAAIFTGREVYRPPMDHPWKRFRIGSRIRRYPLQQLPLTKT